MKTLIKLVIAALVVNGCWKAGSAYWRFYKLKDGAQAAALFAGARSEGEIQNRVIALARELDVPVDPGRIEVRKEPNHTTVKTSYTERIEIVPRYFYPWEFRLDVDALTLTQTNQTLPVR